MSRISAIRTPLVSISFSFVPLMLSGVLLGPKYTAIINVLADLIGSLLFPTGAYFIGFTISALCSGLIYGSLLYQKGAIKVNKQFILRLILSSLIVLILVHGVLNTVWISIITQNAANIIAPARLVKQLIMLPIQVVTIAFVTKIFQKQFTEFKNDRSRFD